MVKPVRVRTNWFKKDGEHTAEDTASVIAANIWRLGDKAVDNLSKADYDIVTPQRGFKIIAELASFLIHYCDRLLFDRVDDTQRGEIINAIALRLAEVLEDNILDLYEGEKDPDYDYQDGFIDLVNRRSVDYSSFEFPADKASFPALRFLSLQIREDMLQSDQSWIQDQLMDIEVPEMMGTVKKSIDGFFPAA